MHHDAGAIHHLVGEVAHDAVIAGQIRFAFAPVHDQGLDLEPLAEGELDRRREGRPAQADHPGQGGAPGDFFRAQGEGIGDRIEGDPFVLEVGFDADRRKAQARGMGRGDFDNGDDHAGHRGVNGGGNIALGLGQDLALQDLLPDHHDGPRGAAHMLVQGHVDALRWRQLAKRHIGGRALVVVRMNAPARFLENALEKSHGDIPQAVVAAGLGHTQCCSVTGIGIITMASVGQRSTQAAQPVQASRMTL